MKHSAKIPLLALLPLLLVACSNNGTDPVEPSGYTLTEYFWPDNIQALQYNVTSGGEVATHYLTFSRNSGSTQVLDILLTNGHINASGIMTYSNKDGDIVFEQFGASTVIRPPSDMEISGDPNPRSIHLTVKRAIPTGGAVAGTTDQGCWFYDQTINTWEQRGLEDAGAITHIAVEKLDGGKPRIFAATSDGRIHVTENMGVTWFVLSRVFQNITAMTCFRDVALLVATGSQIHRCYVPYDVWDTPLEFAEPAKITAMDTRLEQPVIAGGGYLYVGTSNGMIYMMRIVKYEDLSYDRPSSALFHNEITELHAYSSKPLQMIALSNASYVFLHQYIGGQDIWQVLPSHMDSINTVASTGSLNAVYFGTQSGVWRRNQSTPGIYASLGLDGRNISKLLILANDDLMAFSDSSVFVTSNQGFSWFDANDGLQYQGVPYKGLTLVTGALNTGDSWTAGTVDISTSSSGVFTSQLTGRLMIHFDELLSTDRTQTYYDVLAVRYAVETSSGKAHPSYHYGLVYFV